MTKILVGIPVFNGARYLRDCLASIIASKLDEGVNLQVVVVDDASTDETSKIVLGEFPKVKLLHHNVNLGVTKSNNELLFEASEFDYFVRADVDTIFDPEALSELIKFLQEHQEAGLVSARIVNTAGEDSTSCFKYFQSPIHWFKEYNFLLTKIWRLHCCFSHPESQAKDLAVSDSSPAVGGVRMTVRRVKALASTAIMARVTAVSKVGLFDENLPFFLEDSDWAKRFWDSGFEVYVNPKAVVTHIGGSSNELIYIMCREQSLTSLYRFTDKHFPGIGNRWLLLTSVLGGTLINLVVATLLLPLTLSSTKVRQIVFKNHRSFRGVLKWHLQHLRLFLNYRV